MPLTPEHILFPCHENDFNAPFKDKTELAKALISTEGSVFKKKKKSVESMKAHLSAVFRSSANNLHRPYTKEFHDSLWSVIKAKVKDKARAEGFFQAVNDSFKFLKERKKEKLDPDGEIQNLLDASRKATLRFIVTSEPAEIYLENNSLAQELNNLLIDLLGDEKNFNRIRYQFFFPNEGVAFEFWQSLYNTLKRDQSLYESYTVLEKANDKMIKVYTVDEEKCLHTVTIFDPIDKLNRRGFFIMYKKKEEKIIPIVGEYDSDHLDNVYKTLFVPLDSGDSNRNEIKLKELFQKPPKNK